MKASAGLFYDVDMVKIVQLPCEDLHKKCRKVRRLDGSVRRLINTLRETLKEQSALGVAAPQIGVPLRVIVADLALDGSGREILGLVNPEIVSGEGEAEDIEGCLSVPGKSYRVARYEKVTVRAIDEAGREVTLQADGLLARVLQHEIDHLEGKLIADHGALVPKSKSTASDD